MKNPPKQMSASDAAVLKALTESAEQKYPKRFADMKARVALDIARGLRATVGEVGRSDADLAAWAWHVHEKIGPSGGASIEALRREGWQAGNDIAAGSFAIQQAGEVGFGLDAMDVGYMLRASGIHERDGAAYLQRLGEHARRINVALSSGNMQEVANSLERREGETFARTGQHRGTYEAHLAKKARAEAAAEAEAYQEAEAEAERAEERRIRSMTATAPERDWRTQLEVEEGAEGSETEAHLRGAGTTRGAGLETDREAVQAVARALAKAGMASAAKEVRSRKEPPTPKEIRDLAEEAYERTKDARLRGELHRLAQGLSIDEESRERGHAWMGARDIEHDEGSRADIIRSDARRRAAALVRKYPLLRGSTVEDLATSGSSVTEYDLSQVAQFLEFSNHKTEARVFRDLSDSLYGELTDDEEEHDESAEIASRSRLIELNPPKSPEERAVDQEMERLDHEKRRLFYEERDKVPVPESGWYDEEYTKGVHKKIRPLTDPIDAQLRDLRAKKKAIREAQAAEKAARPPRVPGGRFGPEIRQGRCKKCDIRYKWVERPNVKTGTSGPNQWWKGIACPKCGGTLWRTATAHGSYLDSYVDLDTPGAGQPSSNPGVDGFDFADDFGRPAEPEAPGRLHLDTLKRGDVVRVGKTRWHVFNAKHGAWVVKYGTSGKKMYQIYSGGGDRFVVQQMTGGGDLIGDPVAEGDAEVVGWEERA